MKFRTTTSTILVSQYDSLSALLIHQEITGHFTQVVWIASTELGCAWVPCNTADTPGNYLMCEYQTAGNVIGVSL